MPKENTHIYFASTLYESLESRELKDLLKKNLVEYYLGSIAPDIYFYHKVSDKTMISSQLHGCNGELTNGIILAMIRDNPSHRDFAFAAGYMTHTVLDMTFHPVVYYLSGNYYDEDPEKEAASQYRHRYLETALDMVVGSPLKSNRIFRTELLEGLRFNDYLSEEFGVEPLETAGTLKRQISLNGLMTRRSLYPVLRLFTGSQANRGLFYGSITRRDRKKSLNDEMEVRDIFTGEKSKVTFNQLFTRALETAGPRIHGMYRYISGTISEEELKKLIPGESLDTGSTERVISEMRYSLND